jgi:toxin ParE1/3/4
MKTHRLAFHSQARADLFAIYGYVEEASGVQTAGAYVQRIEAVCLALTSFPERGTLREDVHPPVRTLGFERRATIVFRIADTEIEILRVLYGGQDIERVLHGPAND